MRMIFRCDPALEPHLLRPKSYLVQKVAECLGDTFGRMTGIGA